MKRMITLVLSLVMALSLCAPAWGAGTITYPADCPDDLPIASVVSAPQHENTDIEWGSFSGFGPDLSVDADPKLEAAYIFRCADVAGAESSPYANWYCDFYVKLDKNLAANQIFLGGNYGSFGWVGFHNGDVTLEANEELPLLGSVVPNEWTYADIAAFVGTFTCGVSDVDDALEGATFTVMLRLTNPADTSEYYNVATVDYTFGDKSETKIDAYGLTLIPNGANSKIIVKDKEGFLNLSKLSADWVTLFTDGSGTEYPNYANGAGDAFYYSSYWTISLDADIDLNNDTIDPVLIELGEATGCSHFDGNGHTIKNAVITTDPNTKNEAGLFDNSRCDFKNLKLDNIQVTGSNVGDSSAGILAGSVNEDQGVQNITITNSSVTGGKYTGGLVGYGYTDIIDCTLTNVTVKGGYKLGGLIGYICANPSNVGDITGNTLTNCTVDGIGGGVFAGGKDKYIVGKLASNYNCDGTCGNNTIVDMTTSATQMIGKIESGWTVDEKNNTETTTPAPKPPVYYPPVEETPTEKPAETPAEKPAQTPTQTPTTPAETPIEVVVPVVGNENTVKVEATVTGTTATVDKVDMVQLETVIGDDVDTGKVTIDFSTTTVTTGAVDSNGEIVEAAPVDTVQIPAEVIAEIAEAVADPENNAESLEVVLGDGASIEFDAAALAEKVAQAGGDDITISIKPTTAVADTLSQAQIFTLGESVAFDITVTSGGVEISDMGGNITISAPYELAEGETAEGIVVYYVDDAGNREKCETVYDAATGRVSWVTNHLSVYMVSYEAPAEDVTPDDGAVDETPADDAPQGGSPVLWIVIAVVVIAAIVVAVVVSKKRKN